LRSKKQSGEFRYFNDYPSSMREMIDKNTFALYKLGNELGTINLAASGTLPFDEQSDFLLNHGIQQHLIVLSINEISRGSLFVSMNLLSGLKLLD
jgi:hypothetical protein